MSLRISLGTAALVLSLATTANACEYMAQKADKNHELVQQTQSSPVLTDAAPRLNSPAEVDDSMESTAIDTQPGFRISGRRRRPVQSESHRLRRLTPALPGSKAPLSRARRAIQRHQWRGGLLTFRSAQSLP